MSFLSCPSSSPLLTSFSCPPSFVTLVPLLLPSYPYPSFSCPAPSSPDLLLPPLLSNSLMSIFPPLHHLFLLTPPSSSSFFSSSSFKIVEFVQSDREQHMTIPIFSRSEKENENASQKSNASKDKRDDDVDWEREIRTMPSVDKLVDDKKVTGACLPTCLPACLPAFLSISLSCLLLLTSIRLIHSECCTYLYCILTLTCLILIINNNWTDP